MSSLVSVGPTSLPRAHPRPAPPGRTRPESLVHPRSWVRIAVVVVTEPPFVPRRIWPRTLAGRLLDRAVPGAVNAVLNRIDLNQIVLDRVSMTRIVDGIDIPRLLDSIDISGLAVKVTREIDLAGIVRASSGTLASEGVTEVRLQGASADDTVDRVVARLVPRRRQSDPHESA